LGIALATLGRRRPKCAYFNRPFENGDECQMIDGRPYHRDLCVERQADRHR
jgi:hypothetical protein